MAIALVGSNIGQFASTSNVTLNTTGANFIVLSVVHNDNASQTITDSNNNTWTPLTQYSQFAAAACQIFYAVNPTVGSGHTFTSTFGSTGSGGIVVSAWSGVATSSPGDGSNGTGYFASTGIQAGSITPSVNGDLIIAAISCDNPSGPYTVDSSLTILQSALLIAGTSQGLAHAYLIQSTAGAINPTWTTGGGSSFGGVAIAAFKAGAGGGTTFIGWSHALDADRPGLAAVQSDARQAFVPLFVTAKTPNGIVWPTGSDKERPPPIPRQPDERYFAPQVPPAVNTNAGIPWVRSADEARIILRPRSPDEATPFFMRSLIPVPTVLWTPPVPDREKLPPIKENPDPAKQWFVQSPNPVPTVWLPQAGGKDVERLPPLDRLSDRYVVTWLSRTPPSVPISGMAWHISKEELRPPKPPLNPDEFKPWFVRSPVPVPNIWWPSYQEEKRPPLPPVFYVVTWPADIPPPPPIIGATRLRTLVGTGL